MEDHSATHQAHSHRVNFAPSRGDERADGSRTT
jgi:hypothetical protein